MKSFGRRTTFTLAAMCIIAGVFFATGAILSFPTGDLLSRFFIEWIALQTYSMLITYFIPLCSAALLASVSFLFAPKSEQVGKSVPFSKIINTTVIMLLGVLCIFVFVKEVTLPGTLKRMEDMKYLTDIAEYAKTESRELYSSGNFREADEMLRTYMQINPDDRSVYELRENILMQLSDSNIRAERDEQERAAGGIVTAEEQNITRFIEKAEYYFRQRDYYSAHYFANQALLVDPNRVDMKNLAARSWQKINELGANAETVEQAQYYQRKRAGYTAIQDERYIDAYYIFHELNMESMNDPDIRKYLNMAEGHVKSTAYFIDEIDDIRTLPGTKNIFFLNPGAASSQKGDQFIFMGEYIISNRGVYAVDIEIIEIGGTGPALMHLYAPYGKLLETSRGQVLVLKGVSRNEAGTVINPVIYTAPENTEFPLHILPLNISRSGIEICSLDSSSLEDVNLPRLLSFRSAFSELGYPAYIIEMELINRLLVPFTFLIISFFSLSLGWVLHIPGELRKRYMFLILPALPFFTVLLTEVYNFSNRIFYLYFLRETGFAVTVILLVTASTGLLILSLLILAFQSSK